MLHRRLPSCRGHWRCTGRINPALVNRRTAGNIVVGHLRQHKLSLTVLQEDILLFSFARWAPRHPKIIYKQHASTLIMQTSQAENKKKYHMRNTHLRVFLAQHKSTIEGFMGDPQPYKGCQCLTEIPSKENTAYWRDSVHGLSLLVL